MSKDFPSRLFCHSTCSDSQSNSSITDSTGPTVYKNRLQKTTILDKNLDDLNAEIHDKFNYKHFVDLDFDPRETDSPDGKIKCLTQNYYYGDCIIPTTKLLPCNLADETS